LFCQKIYVDSRMAAMTFPLNRIFVASLSLYLFIGPAHAVSKTMDDKENQACMTKKGWEFPGGRIGDILLDNRSLADEVTVSVFSDWRHGWPNGLVPYEFDVQSKFEVELVHQILNAMQSISNQTQHCVQFVERTTEPDYIYLIRGNGCYSDVGRRGGKQKVSLAPKCSQLLGDMQHKLMHVLGFYHETSRNDRDEHITIYWENVKEEPKCEFAKFIEVGMNDLPYDYESVMHYGTNKLAINQSMPTIKPNLKGAAKVIGQRVNLSILDVARIKKAYKCENVEGTNTVKVALEKTTMSSVVTAPSDPEETSAAAEIHQYQ
jgi:hypothetical protein